MIGHFTRCAVVTDIGWIATAAQVEGALIPGLAIKSFGETEVRSAEAWLMRVKDEEDDDPNFPV